MKKQKNHCIDCGKEISEGSKKGRCEFCANKGEKNPFFGKHHTEETKIKIGNGNLGNYKYNISKSFLIKEYLKNKKSSAQIAEIIKCGRNTILRYLKRYSISIRNRNEIHKGNKHPMFGKVTHGKWGKYKGISMRSSYEIAYAKYLDKQQINWLYEFKTFDLGHNTYTPDFYLSELDKYIEIKGWWRDKGKKKFKLFKRLYPKVKIEVLMRPELIEKGVL